MFSGTDGWVIVEPIRNVVPGAKGGMWEGGLYRVIMEFSEDYPAAGPKVKCDPNFPMLWHMNIWR